MKCYTYVMHNYNYIIVYVRRHFNYYNIIIIIEQSNSYVGYMYTCTCAHTVCLACIVHKPFPFYSLYTYMHL